MTHTWISDERWFQHLQRGTKNIEARLTTKVKDVQIGDEIKFVSKKNHTTREVESMQFYPSMQLLFACEGMETVLPGVKTMDEGIAVFRKWYDLKTEKRVGVVAVRLKSLPPTGIERYLKKRKT